MITVTSGVKIFISITAISFFQQGVFTDTDGVFGRFNDISAVTVGMGGRREYWISVLEMVVKLIMIRVCKINRRTKLLSPRVASKLTYTYIHTYRQTDRSIILVSSLQ